jgi:hypothetical protein
VTSLHRPVLIGRTRVLRIVVGILLNVEFLKCGKTTPCFSPYPGAVKTVFRLFT